MFGILRNGHFLAKFQEMTIALMELEPRMVIRSKLSGPNSRHLSHTNPPHRFPHLLRSLSVLFRRRSRGQRLLQPTNCIITPLLLSLKHHQRSSKLPEQKRRSSPIYTRIVVGCFQHGIWFFLNTDNPNQGNGKIILKNDKKILRSKGKV